ncbi:YolD-like family protein [Paenibacillus lautus]
MKKRSSAGSWKRVGRTKPVLDPQEMELIEQALAESLYTHRTIKLRLFGEYEDQELTGTVSVIHTYRREIKLATGIGEWDWIKINDIVSAN